jgi:hypothetical protein
MADLKVGLYSLPSIQVSGRPESKSVDSVHSPSRKVN